MAFFPSMPDADMKHTLAREPAIGIPFSQLNEAVMRGDAPFSAGERELLAAYVSALNGCDYCQCEHAVAAILATVKEGLQQGDTVILRRFGTFHVRAKRARVGRNPRSGDAAAIAARRVVRFTASQTFKQVVDGAATAVE